MVECKLKNTAKRCLLLREQATGMWHPLNLMNEKMQAIDWALPLGGADAPVTYWGSAEITAERAITCFFSFASTAGNNTKDQQYETNFRVRYILAF